VEVEVTDPQQRQDGEEKVVAPAPSEKQRNGQCDGEDRKKDEVGKPSDRGSRSAETLVQFSTAVSRNPATIAIVKPKTISWLCQEMLSRPGSPDIGC